MNEGHAERIDNCYVPRVWWDDLRAQLEAAKSGWQNIITLERLDSILELMTKIENGEQR